MMYKKVVIKGACLKWANQNIFPVYPPTSGSRVSQRRINRLKDLACMILRDEERKIFKAFKQVSKKRGQNVRVDLDVDLAVKKVLNARVSPTSETMHGESDEQTIWVAQNKVNDSVLLGVLLHEALHYAATFDDREICTDDEHRVIRILGDDC